MRIRGCFSDNRQLHFTVNWARCLLSSSQSEGRNFVSPSSELDIPWGFGSAKASSGQRCRCTACWRAGSLLAVSCSALAVCSLLARCAGCSALINLLASGELVHWLLSTSFGFRPNIIDGTYAVLSPSPPLPLSLSLSLSLSFQISPLF